MVVNIEGERWGIALPAFTEDLCRLLFDENRYPWGHIAYTDCDGNTEMVPVISLQSGTYYGVSRSKATHDACWLPRFVPLKEGLEVDTQAYAGLPFGFESVLGTLWVGEKKREWRGLLRKPLAYRSGTIEIREPDPDERYQSQDHHFKWWFDIAPIRGGLLAPPKGGIESTIPAASK